MQERNKKPLVLIIEDRELDCNAIAITLMKYGYEIAVCPSHEKAKVGFEALIEDPHSDDIPDLILNDGSTDYQDSGIDFMADVKRYEDALGIR